MDSDKKSFWRARIGELVTGQSYQGEIATGQLLDVVAGVWGYGGDAVALVLDVKNNLGSQHWPADKCKPQTATGTSEESGPRSGFAPGADASCADPLFKDRVPEAAARQVAVVLAWLTECQLATLEGLEELKRTSKSELHRQRQICDQAVAHCKDLGVAPVGLGGDR